MKIQTILKIWWMKFQYLPFIQKKKKFWNKKRAKWMRKWNHSKNVFQKHFSSKNAFLHFLMKEWVRPIRIFIGLGGIKAYPMKLDVLCENEDLIIINKPAGLLTHPSKFNEPDTLLNGILFHLGMEGNSHENMPGPISRLDRNTSGVVLFALSKRAKTELGNLMMAHGFTKKYIALVSGKIPEKGEITTKMLRIPGTSKMEITEKGKQAHTIFERIQYFEKENVSLVSVHLLTGRMHQIRLHLSSIGYPIIGDWLYGEARINEYFTKKYGLQRHILHAAELSFEHPILGKYDVKAQLPVEIKELLESLGKQ